MPETKKTKGKAPAAKGGGKKACIVQGCKRAYRAKGLCFFHYKKWRRGELEERPARYHTCSRPDCKKKVVAHGLCQEHHQAWKKGHPGDKPGAPAPEVAPTDEAKPSQVPAAS
jgi:hypothetical protein